MATVNADKLRSGGGGQPDPPAAVTQEDVARGYRLVAETNETGHSFSMPSNAAYFCIIVSRLHIIKQLCTNNAFVSVSDVTIVCRIEVESTHCKEIMTSIFYTPSTFRFRYCKTDITNGIVC